MERVYQILFIILFLAMIGVLVYLQKKGKGYSTRVFFGLGIGIILGAGLQLCLGVDNKVLKETIEWTNIVGGAYLAFLRMLIMPLILISLIRAFVRLNSSPHLGRISGSVIATLLGTTAISAFVGIYVAKLFSLEGSTFFQTGTTSTEAINQLAEKQADAVSTSFAQRIVEFVPKNIFEDLSGLRSTSTIAVVIFSVLVGIAFMRLKKHDKERAGLFKNIIEALYGIVDQLVELVILMAPYGILSLMMKASATSSFLAIKSMGVFVIASYVAIFIQFIIHGFILRFSGVNPITYFKKALPALSFAFTSRSSAGALPINVETQTKKLGVDETSANFSASFGLSIGQNGCAGIYPAMLATIVGPLVGFDMGVTHNVLLLVSVVVLSSLGVAGVGGGATFAALIVFSTLGLPIEIIGLLVSVEPIIDMARTALNVNNSMVAGVISSKVIGKLQVPIFNSKTNKEADNK